MKLQKLKKISHGIDQRLETIYTYRLIAALVGFVVLTVLTFEKQKQATLVALGILVANFIYLIVVTNRLRQFQKKINLLFEFYERQNNRRKGLPVAGIAFENKNSLLHFDLDLYGPHSVFSQLSECLTDIGLQKLSLRLEKSELDVEALLQRQTKVRNLSFLESRLRRFIVKARLHATPYKTEGLLKLIKEPLFSSATKKQVLAVIIFWLVAVISTFIAPPKVGLAAVLIFWFGSYFILGKLSQIFFTGLKLDQLDLSTVIEEIESLTKFDVVAAICPQISEKLPSKKFKKWKSCTDFLGVQANPILSLIVNMLTPWTLFFSLRLETIRLELAQQIDLIFEDVSEFEFYLSLATVFKYQTQTFADFTAKPYFECENLFHPLIAHDTVVKNKFHFNSDEQLGLITGSNMSGKSTFLRAVGINQLLACMGAPVFASKLATMPAQTQSCIRVTDSIEDGASYFYAEVKRLKFILDQIKSTPTFFLIDEVFRGTNNQERLIGAKSLLASLTSPTSFGFVTTHDLELSQTKSPQIVNWHFKDDYLDGKMHFSYKILEGPSSTTNALKIMQNEGLIKSSLKLM